MVTSPPYFGLRDYGHEGQIGLEESPDAYVKELVTIFDEVWRVLADDGTLWLNLGDSYAGGGRGGNPGNSTHWKKGTNAGSLVAPSPIPNGLKSKDMVGIPWRVAFALQSQGWYLRQDIIWAKPNPMPESVTDRCTKSHEYLFLLTKSARYLCDMEAIAEPIAESSVSRLAQDLESQQGSARVPGKTNGTMKAVSRSSWNGSRFDIGKTAEHQGQRMQRRTPPPRFGGTKYGLSDDPAFATYSGNEYQETGMRNKRDVWTISGQPFKGAHFAVMPEALVEPCILAGSREGDMVLDPFAGSGTVGVVALRHQRNFVGVELNPTYAEMSRARIKDDAPLLNEVA